MTFIWPLRSKLTFDHQNNYIIEFLAPKTYKNGTIYHFDISHFLANLLIYQFLFSTLRPKSSPDINGGNRVTIRYPITYQNNTMSFPPTGGGHKSPTVKMTLLRFFTHFCTIIKYKQPNFWYLKFLFQLNVFIGCI